MPDEADLPPHVPAADLAPMIPPARTALVVIDVQEDFVGPGGAMARVGVDMSGVPAALDRVEALIAAARKAGVTVAFARVMTTDATDPGALRRLNARKGRPPQSIAICREDRPGSAYHRVRPEPGDLEIPKRLFNTFHGTDFDARLKARGIEALVICGFTTDCCVDATARDAFHRDYDVFVVSDATDAYSRGLHLGALAALQKNVALLADTDAVLRAWAP